MSLRSLPRSAAEALVLWIARHKYDMLAGSIAAATALVLAALFIIVVEQDLERLNSFVGEVEGYVAIAALVLGLPALGYAMVTDSAIARIEDELGTSKTGLEDIDRRISERLSGFEANLPGHFIQVFAPNLQLSRLVPIYDPDHEGPEEGWSIEVTTPQAITGSAWVGREYLRGIGDELRQSKLRLTADQLKRYEDLTAVAAAPILEGDRRVGVLTVSSKSEDQQIGAPWFRERHEEAARSLTPIIGDYIPEEGALSQGEISARG